MIKLLPIIMLILLGCNTERQFTRQLVKGSVAHRGTLAEYCSSLFPVKTATKIETDYQPGKDIPVYDTVTVVCDTLESIVRVPVIRQVYRVDTLRIKITDTIESTARAEALQGRLVQADIKQAVLEDTNKKLAKKNLLLGIGLCVTGLVLLTIIFKK